MIAQRKLDHSVFIANSLQNIDNFTNYTIQSANECKLSEWIKESEAKGYPFTKTQNWQRLKTIHQNFHQHVQDYITQNANKATNYELRLIAEKISNDMKDIFQALDNVKYDRCNNNN